MKILNRTKSSLQTQLKYYALASVAAVATLGTTEVADAAILHYDPTDFTIGPDDVLYFDLDDSAGGILVSTSDFPDADYRLFFDSNNSEKPTIAGELSVGGRENSTLSDGPKLNAGDPINDSPSWSSFAPLDDDNSGTWDGGGVGYMGLRVAVESVGPGFRYGWARLDYDDDSDRLTLLDFALETTVGRGIVAGAVPEPASWALASLGAIGFIVWRLRRQSMDSFTNSQLD